MIAIMFVVRAAPVSMLACFAASSSLVVVTDQQIAHAVPVERIASRTLDGNELLKIGDLHEVQNHLQEALPYYQRALTAFRGKKDRIGEATALVRIAIVMERQDKH